MKNIEELTDLEINCLVASLANLTIENIDEHGVIGNVPYILTTDGIEMFDIFTCQYPISTKFPLFFPLHWHVPYSQIKLDVLGWFHDVFGKRIDIRYLLGKQINVKYSIDP